MTNSRKRLHTHALSIHSIYSPDASLFCNDPYYGYPTTPPLLVEEEVGSTRVRCGAQRPGPPLPPPPSHSFIRPPSIFYDHLLPYTASNRKPPATTTNDISLIPTFALQQLTIPIPTTQHSLSSVCIHLNLLCSCFRIRRLL